MSWPGLFEGVAVAALASTATGLLHALLPLLVHPATADRLIVLLLAGAYLLYLLRRSAEAAGRLTSVAATSRSARIACGSSWLPPKNG